MGELSCLAERENIGFSNCNKVPGLVRGFITTPKNFSIPLADAGVAANWQDAILADRANRIYLWPNAKMSENVNEAAVYEDTPLSTINVRDGRYRWRLSFTENLNLHKAMFSHKNFQGRIFLIDSQNQITGTSLDGVNFQGFEIDLLNPEKLMFNDGSVSSKTPVYVSLADNLELDERGCLIEGGSFLSGLIRLTSVDLNVIDTPAPSATGFTVSVNSSLDGEAVLGLALADFVLLDAVGAAQTIVGVVDNSDGTYTLSGAGLTTGTINLVSASTLSVSGFESSGAATVTI